MSFPRLFLLTALTMLAFAGNSLLCRIALRNTAIDPTSFTTIRLVSGALTLWVIVRVRDKKWSVRGSWLSAAALLTYALGFSFAYVGLHAGLGSLLLFGAVQVTMISYGLWAGERFGVWQLFGFALAVGGLIGLLLPGTTAPPLVRAMLMLTAGAAWGVYSLRGKGAGDPTQVTAGNFLRSVPLVVALNLALFQHVSFDGAGCWCAVASGSLTSGIGYAFWYSVLPSLKATRAATVQLSVPLLAAFGGVGLLGEPVTVRLVLASVAILGGIGIVLMAKDQGK